MEGFTLDEGKAREWLTANVAQHERWIGGEDADAPAVDIGEDWQTTDDSECPHVPNLLDEALFAGVITQPDGASLAFDADCRLGDPGYQWLVLLGEQEDSFMLAGSHDDVRYLGDAEAHGVEAALSVLREGVSEGNALLASLDRYVASRR
jgi:hypothetical protein